MSGPVRIELRKHGLDWPEPIEWLESVGSTSDVLRERARNGAPAWSAVAALRQTAGRGRQGRSWVSAPGNLYLSVLVRPGSQHLESLAVLPLLAGVAVREAVTDWGVDARLKWPNDLVVGERKLAGILAESTTSGGSIDHVVVGIGLNLVEPEPELRAIATSVLVETGQTRSAPEAAGAVLAACRRCFESLMPAGPGAIVSVWREHAVDWWGRSVEVVSGGTRIEGRAEGVDDSGALLLATGSGTIRVLSGEARALRLAQSQDPEGRP